jgi:predicted phage tail protein
VPGFLALVPWIVGALTAAVGVASYTAAKKAQKAARRPNDEQRGVLVNKESNVEQIPVIYGERRVGGVRVFVSTDGTYKTVDGEREWYSGYHPDTEVYDDVTGTPTNQYLYIALVLAEGEVESITDIYIDDLPITDSKYTGLVNYNVYLGTDDQTMPDSHYLREANEFWTADHRLRGVAFLGLRFKWDEEAFSGIPDVTALVKGKKVYDPRTATTAWSDNPALCIRDYLTNTRYGKGIPTSAIDDTAIAAAADDCDESVTLYDGGGSGKLFTCNAVLDTSKSLFDNLNILLLGCRGFLPYSQGQYRLKIDGSRSSEFTFTNNEIIDGIVITGESKDEKLNRVSVKFPNPDANWQPDTAIWPPAGSTEETTFLAEDGGVLLQEDIDLDTITNYYQARDLARVLVLRSRNALTCSIKTTSEALQLEIADVISITHSTPGWVAKPFQVTQMQLNEDGTVSLNLLEYDSTIYTWEEGTEQTTYPDTNLPDPFTVGVVSNITVTETTTLGSDGTVIPTGLIEWDTSYDRLVNQYEIQYKLTSEADTEFKSIFTSVPKYEFYNAEVGTSVTIRIRAINSLNIKGAFTTATFTINGDQDAPSIPSSLAATAGASNIRLDWTNPTETDLKIIEVYRHTSNVSASATKIASLNSDYFVDQNIATATTYYYWVKAVDFSGNASGFSGSANASATTLTADLGSIESDISTLQTNVGSLQGSVINLNSNVSTAQSNITQAQADINAAENDIVSLETTSSSHTSSISNLNTTVGNNSSNITTLQGTTATTASDVTALETRATNIEGDITATSTALSSLDTRVTTAEGTITTQASSITSLESDLTSLDGTVSGNATAISGLDTRVTSAEGTITSQSSDITTLESSLTTAEGNITASATAIGGLDTRVTSAEGTITSQSSDITTLENTVNDPTTGVSATATAVGGLDTRITTAEGSITSISTDVTTLENTVNDPTTGLSATATAVGGLDTRITSTEGSITSISTDVTTLENTVNNPTTGVTATATAVGGLDTRITTAEGTITSQSTDITALETTVNNATTGVTATATAVGGLTTRVTSAEGTITSQASDITALETTVNNATTGVAATATAVGGLTTRVTDAEGDISVVSSDVTSLTTTVNGNTANITTATESINGVEAKYTVKIDNNGHISGYGLISTANNATPTSTFSVNVDAFKITNATQTSTPFEVLTSATTLADGTTKPAGVYIKTANIGVLNANQLTAGFINADRINANTITAAKLQYGTSLASGSITWGIGAGASVAGVIGVGAFGTSSSAAALAAGSNGGLFGGSVGATGYGNANISAGTWTTAGVLGNGSGAGGYFVRTGSTNVTLANASYGLETASSIYVGGSYLPFTGSHEAIVNDTVSLEAGDIMVDVSVIASLGVSTVLTEVALSSVSNQKTAIGVFSYAAESDYVSPTLQEDVTVLSEIEVVTPVYQTKAEYTDTMAGKRTVYINAVGEGMINVCGESGDIEPGDLIVTSSIIGKGMKQGDDIIRSYTVAKARESATFSAGEVKQIACIYLCG